MGEESINSKKLVFNFLQKFIGVAKKIWVWLIWGGLLFVSIVFDCITEPYIVSKRECIFSYDIGNLVAIIVVIWTFTVTVGMYCLSQLETKYYEVRLVDVFFDTFTFGRALAIIIAVAGEMLLLIVSTIAGWEITIVVIALLQLYTTCFVYALVCLYFTKSAVNLMAQEEIQNILKSTASLPQMETKLKVSIKIAQNTDYESIDEKESLFDLMKMISSGKKCDADRGNKDTPIRELSQILVSGMLESRADYWGEVYPVISKWFRYSKNIEVNKGIIQALVKNHHKDMYQDSYHSCIELIELRNHETCLEEISLWAVACYWYYSDPNHCPGRQWECDYCKAIVDYFPETLQKDKCSKYLSDYCYLLKISRIDLENHIGYCEEGGIENG